MTQTLSPELRFLETGYINFGTLLDPAACRSFLSELSRERKFGPELFMDEADFRSNPIRKGVNPAPGRNMLERRDLRFIEENPVIANTLTKILGPGHYTVIRKVVAAVPSVWLPDWVKREVEALPVANLGAFVKPEYRDVTMFHGIDFHQDVIDYPSRRSDFVTMYVYLDDVTRDDAPLFVMPGSHQFGATRFPHSIRNNVYSDGRGNQKEFPCEVLTGSAGSVALWHACTLHGTQPSHIDKSSLGTRISVRYIVSKAEDEMASTIMDEVNDRIRGPLSLSQTRDDLDERGAPVKWGNIINDRSPVRRQA